MVAHYTKMVNRRNVTLYTLYNMFEKKAELLRINVEAKKTMLMDV